VLALAAAAACHKDTIVTTRTVTAFVPAACGVTAQAFATYEPLGDFEPPQIMPGPQFSAVGSQLPQLDPNARELVVSASQAQGRWLGLAPIAASGDVDVMILPEALSCALATGVGGSGARTGSTLAAVGTRALLVGGVSSGANGNEIPSTFVVDLETAAATQLDQRVDLQTPRSNASVTTFGDGALVAGGGPASPRPTGPALGTAEIYSPALGGFDRSTTVKLSEPRAHQGAVVLAGGQTLLVGGSSDAAGTQVLSRLDEVDASSLQASEDGLPFLTVARGDPTVLRLTSGKIFVAGGFDGGGKPVAWIEWLSSDFMSPHPMPQQLMSGATASAFAALEGGGVLAVFAPPVGAPADFENTWVIDPNGVPTAVAPTPAPITHPVFFGGSGGAPVLWTGATWLRWQPWTATFAGLSVLDAAPANVDDATCSPDPGLALWLDVAHGTVAGLRLGTLNAYSPLQMGGAVDIPSETAPDRIPGAGVIAFDDGTGSLTLAKQGASVFVTDRTYADVSITMTLPTSQPPLVVLRDQTGAEVSVGDPQQCPGLLTTKGATSLDVVRAGTTVTWSVNGGAATQCTTALADGARVSVGLRAGSTRAVARDLFVKRAGEP